MNPLQLRTASERLSLRKKEIEGFRAKKIFGQNFLVSDKVIHRILMEVDRFAAETIIEIGPGLGALTDGLILMPPGKILIELDPDLVSFWRSQDLEVIEEDALKIDWETLKFSRPVCLVSNLPYQISSRLVIERSLDSVPIDFMVLMFQKEVAQKILAEPPSAEVGLLTAVAQTFWKVRSVIKASPHDFRPAPKISSQVLAFTPKTDSIHEKDFFSNRSIKRDYLNFLKAAFSAPRKLLISNLRASFTQQSEKEVASSRLLDIFRELDLQENIRAHQVPISHWKELYLKLKTAKKEES